MTRSPSAYASRRRTKVAVNVKAFYARADYVTPRVALDAAHTKALRAYMKRAGVGVSDAIRAAIIEAGTASKPRAPKSHSATRS